MLRKRSGSGTRVVGRGGRLIRGMYERCEANHDRDMEDVAGSYIYLFALTSPLHTTVTPTTQAGHQTPQTTNSVHTPCAIHPLANSTSTLSRPLPLYHALSPYIATGGDKPPRISTCGIAKSGDFVARTNASGEASRPTTKARLKLRVASMEIVAPRTRRENDCKACSCWVEALKRVSRPEARVAGSVSVLKVSKWRA